MPSAMETALARMCLRGRRLTSHSFGLCRIPVLHRYKFPAEFIKYSHSFGNLDVARGLRLVQCPAQKAPLFVSAMKIERTTPFLDHLRVRLQAAPAGRIRDHFSKTERGSMKFRMHATAAALLAASAVVSYAQAGDAAPAAKKHVHRAQTRPSAQEQLNEQIRQQIDALRQEMQSQIDSLKNDLAAKDAELKQAQQQAADAQAAAARAQQAAEQ